MPCASGRDAEMGGKCLADIRKPVAAAEAPSRDAGPEGQHGHVLARMVGTAPGRITAMIRRDDGDVTGPHHGPKARQPGIEGFQRGRIPGNIAAMAVQRIEVHEVGQGQRTRRGGRGCLQRRLHQCGIAVGLDLLAGAGMGEDVADLANRPHRPARLRQAVEQCRFGRHHRQVLAIAGAAEAAGRTDEGPRDDPADIVGIDETPRDAADRIETLETEMVFVGRDLEDAVGRGVADRPAGRGYARSPGAR